MSTVAKSKDLSGCMVWS